jgi:predicted membrane GTPase involved in stress response
MLGLRSAMLTTSWQTALTDSVFHFYRPRIEGDIQARDKGSLLAVADRHVMLFGMEGAQIRGQMFSIREMVFTRDDVSNDCLHY